ncbi:MAG: DUF3343 domain-containing protein [Chloroflexi bacterium]|nr:DUF3343 domain-containing protein [Chloroflexota bacterium]
MSGVYAVILLQSTSHALRGESLLNKAGIGCKLIPVPRHLSSDCGVCLRIAAQDRQAALQALAEAQLAPEAVCDL